MKNINGRIHGKEIYDVYYSTGGGSMIGGGADIWVNNWIEEIAPHLKVKPVLLIHRNRPKAKWTEEQHQQFENNVKAGRGGNPGRQAHQKIKKTYKEILKDDLEHYWQGDDLQKFGDLLNNARRIHILHGYYAPHKYITDNKDRIYSTGIHVNVNDALNANTKLELQHSRHFFMDPSWEEDIVKYTKNPFWIGIEKPNLKSKHDHLLHIPNYYEFKHNLDVTDNNTVGFASRMETRKCPHYMQRIPSKLCTDPKDVHWWVKNLKIDIRGWKVYKFNYDFLDKFYKQDWGISHSAHIYEPFGYSIFQALDFGKIPILSKDWLMEFDYPFRAFGMHEFYEQWKRICDLSTDGRREWVSLLRAYLREKYGDKERWKEEMLKIYNS